MARTIVHMPYEIAALTGAARTYESHDHSKGECGIVRTIVDCKRSHGPNFNWRDYYSTCCQVNIVPYDSWRFCDTGPDKDACRKHEKAARQKARVQLRAAVRDYNGNGETDISPEPYRHRHQAAWDWF